MRRAAVVLALLGQGACASFSAGFYGAYRPAVPVYGAPCCAQPAAPVAAPAPVRR